MTLSDSVTPLLTNIKLGQTDDNQDNQGKHGYSSRPTLPYPSPTHPHNGPFSSTCDSFLSLCDVTVISESNGGHSLGAGGCEEGDTLTAGCLAVWTAGYMSLASVRLADNTSQRRADKSHACFKQQGT